MSRAIFIGVADGISRCLTYTELDLVCRKLVHPIVGTDFIDRHSHQADARKLALYLQPDTTQRSLLLSSRERCNSLVGLLEHAEYFVHARQLEHTCHRSPSTG